jgi:hypothetical protein
MSWLDKLLGDTPTPSRKATKPTRSAPARKAQGKHTFTLQAPCCAPARDSIEPMLSQYGIIQSWGKHYHLGTDKKLTTYWVAVNPQNMRQPYSLAQQVELTVNKQAARWVETLLRTQNFASVAKGSVADANVVRWVDQRNGRLPRPWIQETCAEAKRKK